MLIHNVIYGSTQDAGSIKVETCMPIKVVQPTL